MTVIRLNNGGSIQVRTGILQGIGPIGPQGVQGVRGYQGEMGPQGNTGPMGQILQYVTKATVASPQAVNFNVDSLVAFPTVAYDDLGVSDSSVNFTIKEQGAYTISAWVRFDMPANAGDSMRALWIYSAIRGVLARTQVLAVADEQTYVHVSWPDKYSSGELINIFARHSDDLAVGISLGALSITRIGSGPQGVQGPTGPPGPVGPAGPQGPQGPVGASNSGYSTYAQLLA